MKEGAYEKKKKKNRFKILTTDQWCHIMQMPLEITCPSLFLRNKLSLGRETKTWLSLISILITRAKTTKKKKP